MGRTTRFASRAISAIKNTWAEYDYANRRLLEIQLGRPMSAGRRAKSRVSLDQR